MRNLKKTDNYCYYTPRTGVLQYYINDISKYKILSPSESKKAVIKAKNGDRKSIEALVNSNQRFVFALSKRFSGGDNTLLLDLIGEANIGLLKSISNFDTSKDNTFLTYSVYWMQRQIFSYITFTEPMIRVTNKNKTIKVGDIKNKFFLENGRQPTNDEIIDQLYNNYGITINNHADINELLTISMDSSSSTEGFEDYSSYYANTKTNESDYDKLVSRNTFEQGIDIDYNKKLISNCMCTLSDKEKKIISLLYGFDSYRGYETIEVAQKIDMTPEGVRQTEKRALKKIKEQIIAKRMAV